MRLIHRRAPSADEPADGASSAREPAVTSTTLASDVDVARSALEQGRGLMFRRSIPDDYALVFPFDAPDTQWLHMLFVPFAIDALWLVDGEVTRTKRLAPFVGLGRGRADTVVELPAGAADAVAVGDEIRLVD
ncbi:DUF192 domain-containing protein [Halorubrum sp. PV6]|uniref:DUF192 domain-containing protein n=1 Tax=Halorubrum sp. PV6 TaxID=634157 RepID=UPI000F85094C|nr:DUF192 domain-containing protein [Halorubrum sp. PV6]AZQ13554.1 DUF192 domain-containing protein [Halorubrum sp. PV6]